MMLKDLLRTPAFQLYSSLHLLDNFGSFLSVMLWGKDAQAQLIQFLIVAVQARVEEEVQLLPEERFGDCLVVSGV